MELSPSDFESISSYIYKISGISIKQDKAYLIKQRLGPLAHSLGCKNFSEFSRKLMQEDSTQLRNKVIQAITTNETSFFRDGHPFDTFKQIILPELASIIKERKKLSQNRSGAYIHILCIGASSGQEPYTISMLIHEFVKANRHLDIQPQDFNILATDISVNVLSKAIAGEYTDADIQRGLSQERLAMFFTKTGNQWRIIDSVREIVRFFPLNIIEPYILAGMKFDIIFCRNVLIYFDDKTKTSVFNTLYNLLTDLGYLFLGVMENIYMLTDKFESQQVGNTVLYRKKKPVFLP